MTRSKRMETIVRMAGRAEEDAARALSQSLNGLGECQARLDELRGYRQEYMQQFQAEGLTLGAAEMQYYRRFTHRLDGIIAQLEQQLAQHNQASDQHRKNWAAQHNKTHALGDIRDRYQREETRRDEHRMQLEIDERAQHVKGRNHDSES